MKKRPFGRASMFALAVVPMLFVGVALAEQFIGTQKGKVYHSRPDECNSARRIRTDNRIVFKDAAEAEKAGRRLCRTCAAIEKKSKDETPQPIRNNGVPTHTNGDSPSPVQPTSLANPAPTASGETTPTLARIEKILSSGTLELDSGDRVCLEGVIVPNEEQPLSDEARQFITDQTNGRLMRIHRDESGGGRDTLGRWRVQMAATDGGRDLAGELIYLGYAWLDRSRPTARWDELARLEEAAWRGQRGIWEPIDERAGRMPVMIGRGATEYHERRCDHVEHLTEPQEVTLNEARARRLVPCAEFREKSITRANQKQ